MSKTTARRRQTSLLPRIKVWLETHDRHYAFGFGIVEILQAVDQAGSIKEAARDLGKSYRYVWGRIKQAEQALGRQLVEAQVGGQGTRRSFLTSEERRLGADFMALRRRMVKVVQEEFARCFG
jgi:molybdate transport system regulatory protein